MSALVPYNRQNFANFNYFPFDKQRKKDYFNKYFFNQQLSIPRPFPTSSYYPSYFHQMSQYPIRDHKFHQQYNATMNWTANQVQQQYAQYIHLLNQRQKYETRREAALPPMPTQALTSSQFYNSQFYNSEYYTSGTFYVFEKETRFVPYPVFSGRGSSGVGISRSLPYEHRFGFGEMPYNPMQSTGVNWNLPPKIRVIFMPMNSPSVQSPCINALAMPPFLFNRMAQPFNALPLPPPLPNIAALPLTPAVQQIVTQQYANPVAILPFTQTYSMPQPIRYYPPYVQPPQQFAAPALTSGVQSFDYIPPSYIPPTLLPADMPLLPANAPNYPYFSDASPQQIPYGTHDHSHTCRACVPAPPSLNIPVTGYNWVQHCSACHHVPADGTSANSRSTNGRYTPLLRHPVVNQNVYSSPPQSYQHQPYYPHINVSNSNRPWSYPLPPLPAGAVLISDQYLPMSNISSVAHFSQNYPTQFPRVNKSSSKSFGDYIQKKRTKKRKKDKRHSIKKSKQKNKSPTSTPSYSSTGSSSCSLCNAKRTLRKTKSSSTSTESQQNFIRKELTPAAQNIELRYAFRPQDLQLVYNNNNNSLMSKPTDTDSISFTDSITSLNIIRNHVDNLETLPSLLEIHVRENTEEEEEEEKQPEEQEEINESISSLPVLADLQQKKKKILVIREYSSASPSTISTVSSFRSFNRKKIESDVVSTTSTIKMSDNIKENITTSN